LMARLEAIMTMVKTSADIREDMERSDSLSRLSTFVRHARFLTDNSRQISEKGEGVAQELSGVIHEIEEIAQLKEMK